jgi:hypothetical protein
MEATVDWVKFIAWLAVLFMALGVFQILGGTYKWFLKWWWGRRGKRAVWWMGIEGTREISVVTGVGFMSWGMSIFLNALMAFNPIISCVIGLLVFGTIAIALYRLASARYDARLKRRQ